MSAAAEYICLKCEKPCEVHRGSYFNTVLNLITAELLSDCHDAPVKQPRSPRP